MLNGRAVLIAEDEPVIAMLAEDLIDELGGTVSGIARRCEEALAMLADSPPALVLLDFNLHGGTSESVVEAAKALGIPVLISSGSDPSAFPATFRGLPTLQKPWDLRDMERALAAIFASDGKTPVARGDIS